MPISCLELTQEILDSTALDLAAPELLPRGLDTLGEGFPPPFETSAAEDLDEVVLLSVRQGFDQLESFMKGDVSWKGHGEPPGTSYREAAIAGTFSVDMGPFAFSSGTWNVVRLPGAAPATAIPTLSSWALALLAVAIGGAGIVLARRR